ncbi:Carboxylesterase [Anatilimnocola aggregata]|uniref:Carboxylesterase n=1 Tax=Anatilimnocola aggregata TaxID=2528021 RepID=A0A517Y805_9BACT|nr:alpha/beta hydrolase [Anatilimnocola aggregata]QDU26356.1 Carboxylesterase [Anatilimnocola aggregata]
MKTALVALLLASSTLAAEPVVKKDVRYTNSQHERHVLDVYAPSGAKNLPIVFWIHGGGWQAGDKSQVQLKPQAFADAGFVFVSTNYRLWPTVKIEEMAADIAQGIRWTHDHAAELGGNGNKIYVMGHSAGAQLAALVCTDDRLLKKEGLSLEIIRGCVPVDGDTYDVPLQIATVEERRANIYKNKFGNEASQRDLSPLTHVAKGKHIPPFLLLHVADHPEVKMQAIKLAEALQKAGVPAQAFAAKDKNHTTINAELGQPDDAPTKALWEFVKQK